MIINQIKIISFVVRVYPIKQFYFILFLCSIIFYFQIKSKYYLHYNCINNNIFVIIVVKFLFYFK